MTVWCMEFVRKRRHSEDTVEYRSYHGGYAAKYRSYVSEPADQTAAGGQRYASGIRSAESGTGY